METYQVILLVVLLLSLAVYLEVKMQKTQVPLKPKAAFEPLNFDESDVLACLLTVRPGSVYQNHINKTLLEADWDTPEGVENLRLLIKEVSDQVRDCPYVMKGVLGELAFEAVCEYNSFLISSDPAASGVGSS